MRLAKSSLFCTLILVHLILPENSGQTVSAAVSVSVGSQLLPNSDSFEANLGQAPEAVKLLSRGKVYDTYLAPSEILFRSRQSKCSSATGWTAHWSMRLVGANKSPLISGEEKSAGVTHYYLGNDPTRWLTNVPSYQRVRYQEVYPGTDILFRHNGNRIQFDFLLSPGADPGLIRLEFFDVDELTMTDEGDLIIAVGCEQYHLSRPLAFQKVPAETVRSSFVLRGDKSVGVELGEYDPSSPLVLDPVLSSSTYLGGSRGDVARSVAVDSLGFVHVLGRTSSPDFPVLGGQLAGFSPDLFLLKLDPQGSGLVYSAYLGGTESEDLFDISGDLAIDSGGNVWITGDTGSPDFPTVKPFQASLMGTLDAVLAKFDVDGNLLFSTYLGGERGEAGFAIAVDSADDVYVAGATQSQSFPTLNAAQDSFAGGGLLGTDGFIAKFKSDGSELVYSTYIGGSLDDVCFGIGVDAALNAYVSGGTASADFPTVNARQPAFGGGSRFLVDAFVAQLNRTGDSFGYSTYLGGSGDDVAFDLAVDDAGKVAITGGTSSADFPTSNPLQGSLRGGGWHVSDAFVTVIPPGGASLDCSTFLGGSPGLGGVGDDAGIAIALDGSGVIHVAGATSAVNFPVASPFQARFGSVRQARADAFVTRLAADCSEILFSSYLGGEKEDIPFGLAVSPTGELWIAGTTESVRFPAVHALEPAFKGGGHDGFLAKISETKQIQFAHFGDGRSAARSISSLIALFNLSSVGAAHASLQLMDDDGMPMVVDLNGEIVEGSTQVTIPADGLVILETDGEGKLQAGSVTVTTNGEISGAILFEAGTSEGGVFRGFGTAGVLSNQRLRRFRAPMQTSSTINSGVAFMSLSAEDQTIELELRNSVGQVVAEAELLLKARGHVSKYVTELNWDTPPNFSEFLGTIGARSSQDFAATVILVTAAEFATLPVQVSEEPERFFFAQFGDGTKDKNSLASEITLFNLSDENAVSAGLVLENDQGDPMTVDLNGDEIQGFVQVEIPAGNVIRLATDGEGPLQAGSVEVFSDRQISGGQLAGVLLFRGFGLAGVQAYPPLRMFRTLVRKDGRVNSGLALKNASWEQDITLELRNSEGKVMARALVHLNFREHVSKFVDEFDWDVPVDFNDFTGTLTGTGTGDFAAMAILVTKDEFATFPVKVMR